MTPDREHRESSGIAELAAAAGVELSDTPRTRGPQWFREARAKWSAEKENAARAQLGLPPLAVDA